MVPSLPEFLALNQMLNDGTNLQIVGYDGYREGVEQSLWDHFNDTSRPFGHELVLYTLLTVPNPDEYPWRRFQTENSELYAGMFPEV
jgi:hypothetical protein